LTIYNQAVRDLPIMKVQQKISGNSRNWNGAKFYRIRGYMYIYKIKRSSISVIHAIQGTLEMKPFIILRTLIAGAKYFSAQAAEVHLYVAIDK
jgi:hypothetical protein